MSAESADKDRAQVRGAEIVESNAAIEARLNDKVFSLFALHQATQLLSSTLNPKLLAEMAVDVVIEISHSTNGALYLTDDRGAALRLAAAKSIEGKAFPSEYSSEVSFALAAGDQLRQPFLYTLPGEIGMALVAPLCPQGQFVGCFILQGRRKMEPWTEDDIENLGTLASHVGLCLQNARLHQQVLDQYEALKEAQAQLVQTEKLATMGQLLAGVAHELNNPLSVVLGQTALLRATAGNGPLVERAEKIANAAARSARIVQNFLAIARQRPPERQRVRLNRVIQDAVELLAYPLRVDNVEVRLELADDLPPLWADPHQLHQVAVNLISNAHQALRETSPPRWLTLITRTDPTRGRVVLEVADTGPGIAPEIQTRIFEPFFTTKPPGQGTGLGLSLCQGIVMAHGGSIGVESQVGQGAAFVVELPVEVAPLSPSGGGVADVALAMQGKTILVVDDEPEVVETLADLLRLDSHQVETAANGVLALGKVKERPYDVILSDLRMPELDGPGLYRELERSRPELLRRVIFLSGDTLTPDTLAFVQRTRAPVVTKPFALEEVRRAIQLVLHASGEQR